MLFLLPNFDSLSTADLKLSADKLPEFVFLSDEDGLDEVWFFREDGLEDGP